MNRTHLTHAGWFGWCPVYCTPEAEEMVLVPRGWLPHWCIDLNAIMFQFIGTVMASVGIEFTPGFPIRITRKLAQPIILVVVEEETDAGSRG